MSFNFTKCTHVLGRRNAEFNCIIAVITLIFVLMMRQRHVRRLLLDAVQAVAQNVYRIGSGAILHTQTFKTSVCRGPYLGRSSATHGWGWGFTLRSSWFFPPFIKIGRRRIYQYSWALCKSTHVCWILARVPWVLPRARVITVHVVSQDILWTLNVAFGDVAW